MYLGLCGYTNAHKVSTKRNLSLAEFSLLTLLHLQCEVQAGKFARWAAGKHSERDFPIVE